MMSQYGQYLCKYNYIYENSALSKYGNRRKLARKLGEIRDIHNWSVLQKYNTKGEFDRFPSFSFCRPLIACMGRARLHREHENKRNDKKIAGITAINRNMKFD